MGDEKLKALLIGDRSWGASHLVKHLQQRGFRCEYATSYEKVRSLLRARHYDLVLSPMRLRDDSLFPLIEWLDGSDVTLFYCCPVESGAWWLPALRRGEGCFGSSALRSSEFVSALDEVLAHLRPRGVFVERTPLSTTRVPGSPLAVHGNAQT
jgi:hypothetical protein